MLEKRGGSSKATPSLALRVRQISPFAPGLAHPVHPSESAMSRFLLPASLGAACGLMLALPNPTPAAPPPAPPKPEEELVEKVRKGIDKGVAYLKKQQSPQGNWEGIVLNFLADMDGGSTGLVTLALLNCGVKPQDPAVAKALDYLQNLPPRKTYVVALQNLVFLEARDPKYLPKIQTNADWLVQNALGLKG